MATVDWFANRDCYQSSRYRTVLRPLVPVMINFAGGSISTDDLISDEVNDLAVIRTSTALRVCQQASDWALGDGGGKPARLRSLGEFRDSQ